MEEKPFDDQINFRYTQPLNAEYVRLLDDKQELVTYLPGTSCRIWYTQLDTSYAEHWHNALEIVVGENGMYVIEIGETTYEVRKGEILIVPPGIAHALSPKDGCTGFIYLLEINILKGIKSTVSVMSILENPTKITERDNPRLHMVVSALLVQMRLEYFSTNSMRELLVYAYLLTLLAEVGNCHFESQDNLPHVRPDKRKECVDRLNDVLYYVNHHYMKELSIDMISRQFGFSRFYFARLFKQYTGYTFCEYLAYRRIKAAESLLSELDMSITDIAYQTGFSSISTFSRVFKQMKNCTPSEYRKIFEQNNSL